AMTELREIGFGWVPCIQSRRGIIGWKQNQRVQERDQAVLVVRLQSGEGVAHSEGFTRVTENDVVQSHAATVVTVRSGASDTPQRPGEKLCLKCSVPVALVEIRSQIVALEIRENVFDDERIA